MIRVSEMVLPGHPDKFCDQVADAIIAECVAIDADAYGQVEVSTWSDHVWLSGGICTRKPLGRKLDEIVVETGLALGYRPGNHIDASRYKVTSTVCQLVDDPARWSAHVNDQSVVVGWAGYDPKTAYLPPEHYLAHAFREGLIEACRSGRAGRPGAGRKAPGEDARRRRPLVARACPGDDPADRVDRRNGHRRCDDRRAAKYLLRSAGSRPDDGAATGAMSR